MKYSVEKYCILMSIMFGIGGYAYAGTCCNTATGSNALNSDTTGDYNTGDGYQSLYNNQNGNNNTAIGYFTLYNGTSIFSNTAVGFSALASTTGSYNTAVGDSALVNNLSGQWNTAIGYYALNLNQNASFNTAVGDEALLSNTVGVENTAVGDQALKMNVGTLDPSSGQVTAGYSNSAFGGIALYSNTQGYQNTASGEAALYSNQTGNNNSAHGVFALYSNQTGTENTAVGAYSLYKNVGSPPAGGLGGSDNSAFGDHALYANTTGYDNTALGATALENSNGTANVAVGVSAGGFLQSGSNNTALGYDALAGASTGSNNIALGFDAGLNVITGNYNIDIGSKGAAADGRVIRIGTEGTQNKTFVAGIYNVTTLSAGLPVLIDSAGQLGTVSSSERFKTAIAPMASNTAKLQQLRPVTFRYKADSQGTLRYGLIAEEVAKVYPELVVRDKNGRIDGVRYDELAPMLLNEMQLERKETAEKINAQTAEIRELKGQVAELNNMKDELRAVLQQLKSKNQLVAQR